MDLLSMDNSVFKAYAFYAGVLAVKMLFMFVLTKRARVIVANSAEKKKKVKKSAGSGIQVEHDDIERVRRAHRNDVESIPVYLVIAFLYTLTDPPAGVAINLFRVFTAARIIHTLVYAVVVMPQPSRFLAFIVGVMTSSYMAVQVVLHFV